MPKSFYDGFSVVEYQAMRAKFPASEAVHARVRSLRDLKMTLPDAFEEMDAHMPANAGWDDLVDLLAHREEVVARCDYGRRAAAACNVVPLKQRRA